MSGGFAEYNSLTLPPPDYVCDDGKGKDPTEVGKEAEATQKWKRVLENRRLRNHPHSSGVNNPGPNSLPCPCSPAGHTASISLSE